MTLPFDELNSLGTLILENAVETTADGVKKLNADKCCDIILDYLIYCYVMGVDNANEMLFTSFVPQTEEMNRVIYERVEGKNFEERVREYAEQSAEPERREGGGTPPSGGLTPPTAPTAPTGGGKITPPSVNPSGGAPTGAGEITVPPVIPGGDIDFVPEIPGDILYDILRVARTEAHRIVNRAAFDTARKAGAGWKTWNCLLLPTSRDTHIDLNGTTLRLNEYFVTLAGNAALYPGSFGAASEDVNCLCYLTFEM